MDEWCRLTPYILLYDINISIKIMFALACYMLFLCLNTDKPGALYEFKVLQNEEKKTAFVLSFTSPYVT